MLGSYITFPELLIWLPLLAGIICFFTKREQTSKGLALFASLIILGVSIASLFYADKKYATYNTQNYYWLEYIGNSFFVGLDGTGRILTFLTALSFPVIFIATYKNSYKNSASFYGLMLLTQAGLMGVFVALDAFYAANGVVKKGYKQHLSSLSIRLPDPY